MNVPILNPKRANAPLQTELAAAALRVLHSGRYILGEEVNKFEQLCANYLRAKHAIGVSSGTDALLLTLMAYGIERYDEIICPSFTFFATAGSIARTGAKPVFVDILPDCFTLDPAAVEKAITPRTVAIMPVHLFGQCADMDSIRSIAGNHGLLVIEDAAQAIGAELNGVKAGSLGHAGCFSFFPSKNLGGFGDAGLIITNDEEDAELIRELRVHGGKEQYVHEFIGGNFRIDAIQAALLSVKLPYLPYLEEARMLHAEWYTESLENTNYVLPKHVRGKHIWNQYTIRVPNGKRDKLRTFLAEKEISSGIYYPIPLHKQECFQNIVPENLYLPKTEKTCQECLSLPIASELTEDEISYVIDALIEFNKSM